MNEQSTDHTVTRARNVLADAETAIRDGLTAENMPGLVGRLTGTMQGLLEYVGILHERIELTQQIAESEKRMAETRAYAVGRAAALRERDERFDQAVANIRDGAR